MTKSPERLTPLRGLGVCVAVLGLVLGGCGEEEPSGSEVKEVPAPVAESAQAQTPEAPARERPLREGRGRRGMAGKGGKGGPTTQLLHLALAELELTDDQQKTLRGLIGSAKADDARAAHKELRDALAAGVRAGALDDALVETKLKALEELGAAERERMHTALDKLHATLTPAQRVALVESIGDKLEERFPEPEGDDADAERGERTRRGALGRGAPQGNLKALLRDIELSAEQETKLRAALASTAKPDRDAMLAKVAKKREKLKAMVTAFGTDAFDAKALAVEDGSTWMAQAMRRQVEMVRVVLGIIDAEQREALAKGLEQDPRDNKSRRVRGKPGLKRNERGGVVRE